jgi:hypothetical protein
MRRFVDFMDVHQGLGRALAEHQEALAGLDLGRAAEWFAAYDRMLRAHIGEEEAFILPLYEALVPAGGEAAILRGEHRRFEVFLDEIAARLAALAEAADPRPAVVKLFDREAVLKGILEHHDLRERNALYPALDRRLGEGEAAALVAAIEAGGPLPGRFGELVAARAAAAGAAAGRRVADVRIGLFLVAVKLASGAVGLAAAPPAAEAGEATDPDAFIGRDAAELAETARRSPAALDRAIGAAADEAARGGRHAPMPERLMTLVSRGARWEQIGRLGES